MKKWLGAGFLLVAAAVAVCMVNNEEEPQLYSIPKENTYVGTVIFSNGSTLVGAVIEDGEQIKRVGGRYILIMDEHSLVVEIYSWGTRRLFKKEVYTLSELQQMYPEGVSIWVEQDTTSATVVFVPWQ
jgi:hypothetical protein